jgi:ubiquinone/menaquinone biosynthesis C-methylase UbiE
MTLREVTVAAGRRFARLATNAVLRMPTTWPFLRPLMRAQFDRLAPRWDSMRGPESLAAYEAALAAVDPAPGRALDLGTGTGEGALAIARRFGAAEVVGVDLSEPMLEIARRKAPPELGTRVRFETADASALPYGDASFDLVAHANMIPFFGEVERVLAPGGWALFAFSSGPQTPIYVPPKRLRDELERRGFADFADFTGGSGAALLARKRTGT